MQSTKQFTLLGVVVALTCSQVDAADLYVATWTSNSSLYRVDSDTGISVLIGSTGVFLSGMTFDNTGTLYGWTQDGSLHVINQNNGAATLVGISGFDGIEGALAADAAGDLFAADSSNIGDQLLSINKNNGAGTVIGPFGQEGPDISGMTFIGSTLYGIDSVGDDLVTINVGNGVATDVGSLGIDIEGNVGGLAYDGVTLFMADDGRIHSIDPLRGREFFDLGLRELDFRMVV